MSQESAQGSVAATTGTDVKFKFSVVPTLTGFHLNASLLAMESARKIEEYIKECPQDEIPTCQRNYISYSASSIISAVAALESNINEILALELISDRMLKSDRIEEIILKINIGKLLTGKCKDKLKPNDGIYNQFTEPGLPVMCKYDIISCILTNDLLPDSPVKHDVILLIKIRNLLVHYNIELEENVISESNSLTRGKQKRIKNQVVKDRKLSFSPLFDDPKYSFFPYRIICAPTAEWAYNTVNEFIKIYKNHLNLND